MAVLSTTVAEVGPIRLLDGHPVPDLTSYHDAFLVAAVMAFLAAFAALRINDAEAAHTMVRRGRLARRGERRLVEPAAAVGS